MIVLKQLVLFVFCLFTVTFSNHIENFNENNALSLDQLMRTEVTSFSKKKQNLDDLPASIYVITREDIEHSSATRLEDLLNRVPGIWYSQLSYSQFSFGLRSAVDPLPQSLLFLIDGVPFGSPITGGFIANTFDIALDQIDRIEVVKGPGGAIYGANAATGVINIITRKSIQKDAMELSINSSLQEPFDGYLSFAGDFNESSSWNVWGHFARQDGYSKNSQFSGDSVVVPNSLNTKVLNVFNVPDDQLNLKGSGGVGYTYDFNDKWSFTFKNHTNLLSYNEFNTPFYSDTSNYEQVNLNRSQSFLLINQGSLNWNSSKNNDVAMRVYSNQSSSQKLSTYNMSNFEVELQDNWSPLPWNSLSFGLTARNVKYGLPSSKSAMLLFDQPKASEHLEGGFIQSEMIFWNQLRLTLGLKGEHWSLIGDNIEWSPTARMLWSPITNLSFWGGWSRSVTTPGYIQTRIEGRSDRLGAYWIAFVNSDVQPTEYSTWESGVRFHTTEKFEIDISGFFTSVNGLIDIEIPENLLNDRIIGPVSGDLIYPIYYANLYNLQFAGMESIMKWKPTFNTRIEGSLSLFYDRTKNVKKGSNFDDWSNRIYTPEKIFRFSVNQNLGNSLFIGYDGIYASKHERSMTFDYNDLNHVDIYGTGTLVREPSDLFRSDLFLGWKLLHDRWSLKLWARDLFRSPEVENFSSFVIRYPHTVERSVGLTLKASL